MCHMCDLVPAVASKHAVIEGRQCAVYDEPWLVVLGPAQGPVRFAAVEPLIIQRHVVALHRATSNTRSVERLPKLARFSTCCTHPQPLHSRIACMLLSFAQQYPCTDSEQRGANAGHTECLCVTAAAGPPTSRKILRANCQTCCSATIFCSACLSDAAAFAATLCAAAMVGSSAVSNAGSTNSFFWLHSCFSQSILQVHSRRCSELHPGKSRSHRLPEVLHPGVLWHHCSADACTFTCRGAVSHDRPSTAVSCRHSCRWYPKALPLLLMSASQGREAAVKYSLARQLQPVSQAHAWQQVHIHHSYQACVCPQQRIVAQHVDWQHPAHDTIRNCLNK